MHRTISIFALVQVSIVRAWWNLMRMPRQSKNLHIEKRSFFNGLSAGLLSDRHYSGLPHHQAIEWFLFMELF